MEEKLKDVYENIKDRLSNPLIFSFISSWLICNWRIPVALIWYDKSQFSGCGCNTIFDYIELTYAKYGNTWLPVLIAFGYTLLIPFIKNAIRIVSAQAQKWGEENEIRILDGSKIGIDKYLTLRESYFEKTKKLEEVITNESKHLNELNELSKEYDILNDKYKEFEFNKNRVDNFLKSYNDNSFLDGYWNFRRYDEDTIVEEKLYFIENGNIYKSVYGNNNQLLYRIVFYYNIAEEKKIEFVKEVHNFYEVTNEEKDRYVISTLNYNSNKLYGIENNQKVEYTKGSEPLPF